MTATEQFDNTPTSRVGKSLPAHHKFTFIGVLLFTFYVFFRPYETIPSAQFLTGGAFLIAIVTLIIFLPSQFIATGTLTALPREVKCVLALTLLAIASIPIAKDPSMAWDRFSEQFIKSVLMFIVMVNVLLNWNRLRAIIYISLGVSLYLSILAVRNYTSGEANVEGYRVGIQEIGGLFGNPNEVALHLVSMCPLALAFALGAKRHFARVLFFILSILFAAASTFTYSRGAFLGLMAAVVVFAWKLGKKNRVKVLIGIVVLGGSFLIISPSGYGLRVISIFAPALDPVGSSNARTELFKRSVLVTLRNPWGIGIGNFQVVGARNLDTHNSYTQVSSEIGILGLIAYLIFIFYPFRQLGQLERGMLAEKDVGWRYYLSIGLQSSVASVAVSSFFASVAYTWYIYYLIAYAVCFRSIYAMERARIVDMNKPKHEYDDVLVHRSNTVPPTYGPPEQLLISK